MYISKWKLQISSPLQNLFQFLDSQGYPCLGDWGLLVTGNASSSIRNHATYKGVLQPKTSVKNSKVSGITMP